MAPLKFLPPALCAAFFGVCIPAVAQLNTEFRISKVEPALIESPTYSGPRFDKRVTKPQVWLEVEVTFDWQPRLKEPKYTDELTFNYYILLKAKTPQAPNGVLLVGSVTHASIPQGRDMHSVVYVSPRSLERFFDGRVPATASAAVEVAAVTISKQGQGVAEFSGGSFKPQWWASFQQTPGFVLNKNETPFGPLAWDYYEAIKPKSPGL